METLKRTLREAPVVDRDGYQYFVHPVTDCLPEVEPALLREIATALAERVDVDAVDKIITPEAMGIHHAVALSMELDVPFVVARKRDYGFDDEVAVHQATGYAEGELYVNGVGEGDRLLLVDDVVSTGGTLRAMCDALAETGADLVGALVVIERATDEPRVDLPVEVTSLVTVDVVDGEVVIVDELSG